jgi:outer membrane lipoprotein-sorting protein
MPSRTTELARRLRQEAARALALAFAAAILAAGAQESAPGGDDELARSVVEKADLVRFPQDGFEATVTIETTSGGAPSGTRKYNVLSKGNENTVVMVTEPAAERGQIMLMKGRDLWVFLPNVSQPVRLSLSQRLTGQVANGDLARANFAGDYSARMLRTEVFEGEPTYVLELTANDRSVTYHRVLYWVRKSNAWPQKAEFYSVSGRLLKTATYAEFKRLAGRTRPTRLVMQDALKPDEQSVLAYDQMRANKEIPEKYFDKNFLKRLQ